MNGQVRIATRADAEAVAAIYAPYVLSTAISFEEQPPTAAEFEERIAATLASYPFLVFERDGAVLGYAYGGVHRARPAYRWSVEVTAYVAARAHGQGIGRRLYSELLSLLERQGFHSAFAGIALPNGKSVGLHEAMGFEPIGVFREIGYKRGAWHDVGWWRRSLSEGLPETDPTPFSRLKV